MNVAILALQVSVPQEVIKSVPDIIKAAGQSGLGIVALALLLIAGVVYFLIKNVPDLYKVMVVVLMLIGAGAFGAVALSIQREQAKSALEEKLRIQREEIQREWMQTVQNLRLKLVFHESFPANMRNAEVYAYLQKRNEHDMRIRRDLLRTIRGVGGIVVDFSKLEVGDVINVVVDDGNVQWRSDDMKMLEGQLQMIKQPNRTALSQH
jgi:hypothetical protein